MTATIRPIALALLLCFWGAGGDARADELFPDGAHADYTPDAQNGERLFNAAGCAVCHGVEGSDEILAGGSKIETRFGDLYAPNITHDKRHGIGDWSNADFLNAVINGVAPDGDRYFGAVFPFPSYARMKPEDVLDLRGYIASLETSDAPSKVHNISYLSQTILDLWSSEREALTPLSQDQMKRGQYLVEAVGHCAECHTPRKTGVGLSYELDTSRPYEGYTGILGDHAPKLTPAKLKRAGAEAFVFSALGEAKKLSGQPMVATSMRRFSRLLGKLPVEDRLAMYAYLTGEPYDIATLDIPAADNVEVAVDTVNDAGTTGDKGTPDKTGARALMSQIDQYCVAQTSDPLGAANAQTASARQDTAGKGPDPEIEAAADEFVETYCRQCHAPGKTNSGIFLTDTLTEMRHDPEVLTPGRPEASPLYTSVVNGSMPYGTKPGESELANLRMWITALGDADREAAEATEPAAVTAQAESVSEVSYPDFAGPGHAERMAAMMSDITQVDPRDQPFVRYISLAFMPLPEIDCNQTGALRNPVHYLQTGVNKFINSLSLGPRPVPGTPVRGTDGAVLRIDLRDYSWTAEHWEALTTATYNEAAARTGFSAAAWADLAVAYPYAVDPESEPMTGVIAKATGAVVPVIRGDWMLRFASEAPYYDMFLGLTDHIRDLEGRLGIDVDFEISNGQVVRAGVGEGRSGVSDHNRLLERFDLPRGGYYWKSYDFAEDVGQQSLVLHPDGPPELARTYSGTEPFEHDGGEMIFSLPNGLQGFYLSTAEGDRLTTGPTSIVSFRKRQIGKGVEIVNARSCFDCHANGIISKSDQLRDQIVAARRYDRETTDRLLEMYVDNETLSGIYQRDRDAFLAALADLGATEMNPAGRPVSLMAPESVGSGEIFTYLADQHFEQLRLVDLAREFHLEPEVFRDRVRRIADPALAQIMQDWLSRLDSGLTIHRGEVGDHYPRLLGRMTNFRALRPGDDATARLHAAGQGDIEQEAGQALLTANKAWQEPFEPAESDESDYVPPQKVTDKVRLGITVPETEVHVDDLLVFDITTNKTCELQIFYVEENETVEEIIPEIIGPAILRAGETRRIPVSGSGYQLRFDTPGRGETMFAYCRVGGLGRERLRADTVLTYADERSMTPLRGISQEAVSRVESDAGQSGFNFVTFNVRP